MGWMTGRGAPPLMPYDATPLRTAQVDGAARAAWLLRVTRLASPLRGSAKEFEQRLKAMGVGGGESGLSRRETASRGMDPELIGAYEHLLEIAPGDLSGICMNLVGPAPARGKRRGSFSARSDLRRELDRLSEIVQFGSPKGGDWLNLAMLLTRPEPPTLPTFLIDEWLYRLMDELSRATGGAYRARDAALMRLIGDPHYAESYARTVPERLREPGVQATADLLGLLGAGNHPRCTRAALEVLVSEPRCRGPAAFGLLLRIAGSALSGEEASQVAGVVRRLAHEDPDGSREVAFDLARRMSPQLGAEIGRMVGRRPGADANSSHIEDPPELRRYLAAAQEVSEIDEDLMLERLLREALSRDFTERQFDASMLLDASPYAEVVARTAARVHRTSSSPAAREAALGLLGHLSRHLPATTFTDLLSSPDASTRTFALMSLAHGPGVPREVDLRQHMLDPATRYEAVYAAGMSQHPDLELAATGRVGGEDQRQPARWWAAHGGQFRESVSVGE